jgi:hypothetical protein
MKGRWDRAARRHIFNGNGRADVAIFDFVGDLTAQKAGRFRVNQ